MLAILVGYKIMFTFDMPDGSKNGGLCNHPAALSEVFELVRKMGGTNLVIEDKTIYVKTH